MKPPPTSWFIRKITNLDTLGRHRRDTVAYVGIKYLYEIAKIKKELDYDFINTDLQGIVKVILFVILKYAYLDLILN